MMTCVLTAAVLIMAWLAWAAITGGIAGWYMAQWTRSPEGRAFHRSVEGLKRALSERIETFVRWVQSHA